MDFSYLFWFLQVYAWTTSLHIIRFTGVSGKLQRHPINRYVVECKTASNERLENQMALFRELLEERLEAHNISFEDLRQLDEAPALFSGFSVSIKNTRGANVLRSAAFIKEVYPVLPVSRPVFLQTPRVLSTLTGEKAADLFEPHIQAGISLLHAKGYTCRGVKIAVIDTGCDCKHPALGKGFGEGFKIVKGYDFVGDAYNGTNKPVPDDNPCATCALHGTHIMGVLSANENHMGFRGVCPEATMFSYRVFGCEEDTNDELVAVALLRAYKDGADVFSLSVGAPGGWAGGSIAAVVASRIAQKRVVITSAGNRGDEGMFFATSPSCGTGVFSVGSVQSTALVSYPFKTSTTGQRTFNYFATFAMKAGTFPVYPISATPYGQNDACEPLPSVLPDLSHQVVLVRRSETHACTFQTQLSHLLLKGTRQIIWVNNNSLPEYVTPNSPKKVSVGVVTPEVGTVLREQYFQNPGKFRITISEDLSIDQVVAPDSGKVSSFSNYGPMFDLVTTTPAVLGVGGNVLSTYPMSAGSYAIASGTSISAPQVAGIAALIMSVQPKGIDPQEVYTRMATSAVPVANFSETDILESVSHQGSGLINAWCAATAQTIVSTYSISLNDSLHFNGTQSVSITNKGNSTIGYRVKHVPAGTALTFANSSFINPWPVPLIPKAAIVSFSVAEFRLDPGQTVEVKVNFLPPQGLEQVTLPVYSGFIMLNSEIDCESHTISYYGVAAVLKKVKVFDYGYSYQDNYTLPALDSGLTGLPVEKGHVFTLQGLDVPVVEFRLSFGSPLLVFHLVKGDTALSPVLPVITDKGIPTNPSKLYHDLDPSQVVNNTLNSILNTIPQNLRFKRRAAQGDFNLLGLLDIPDDFPGKLSNSFRGIQLLGSLKSYDSIQRWNPRHGVTESSSAIFNGKVYDISAEDYKHAKPIQVTNGKYRILVRALRITGNPHQEADYEAWLSPSFTIRRSNDKT